MSIIKKSGIADESPVTGFETCQDIQTIKEELNRLQVEMDKYNGDPKGERARVRYWAIRWCFGWESEIPNV